MKLLLFYEIVSTLYGAFLLISVYFVSNVDIFDVKWFLHVVPLWLSLLYCWTVQNVVTNTVKETLLRSIDVTVAKLLILCLIHGLSLIHVDKNVEDFWNRIVDIHVDYFATQVCVYSFSIAKQSS